MKWMMQMNNEITLRKASFEDFKTVLKNKFNKNSLRRIMKQVHIY
jgi:hypothetical protein